MTMHTDAAPARTVQRQVIQPALWIKGLMGLVVAMFLGVSVILVGFGAKEGGGFLIFSVVAVAVICGALYILWPSLQMLYGTKIALWDGYLGLRLPARRKTPKQPAMNDAIPLSAIVRLATRIEITHTMGQIVQMRQFALLTDEGRWIEYGGCIENPAMGGVGEPGRVALAAVAAISGATGLVVEDQGVVQGERKGVAGTPWGGAALGAPVAAQALAQADKNSSMWRNILVVVFAVLFIAKMIAAFAK